MAASPLLGVQAKATHCSNEETNSNVICIKMDNYMSCDLQYCRQYLAHSYDSTSWMIGCANSNFPSNLCNESCHVGLTGPLHLGEENADPEPD